MASTRVGPFPKCAAGPTEPARPEVRRRARPPWRHRWTLGVCAVLVLCNLGLFVDSPPLWGLLAGLQFDGEAVRAGEWWRLLTFNLVHWTPRHFLLNLVVFLGVGWLYEPYLRRWYPWLLLGSGAAVGLGLWLWLPERSLCRGVSGVIAFQVAAALTVEFALAWREPRRWLWLAPVVVLFVVWLAYKWYAHASGQGFSPEPG
jgi:membrane associated rhomboid family serine protease